MADELSLNELKRLFKPILRRYGVVRAGVFGSYARGEAKKRSDIDVLVKLDKNKSLLDLVRLERELGEKTGRKVDLVEYNKINERLKAGILQQEVRII